MNQLNPSLWTKISSSQLPGRTIRTVNQGKILVFNSRRRELFVTESQQFQFGAMELNKNVGFKAQLIDMKVLELLGQGDQQPKSLIYCLSQQGELAAVVLDVENKSLEDFQSSQIQHNDIALSFSFITFSKINKDSVLYAVAESGASKQQNENSMEEEGQEQHKFYLFAINAKFGDVGFGKVLASHELPVAEFGSIKGLECYRPLSSETELITLVTKSQSNVQRVLTVVMDLTNPALAVKESLSLELANLTDSWTISEGTQGLILIDSRGKVVFVNYSLD